jgi:hypothetical protein
MDRIGGMQMAMNGADSIRWGLKSYREESPIGEDTFISLNVKKNNEI